MVNIRTYRRTYVRTYGQTLNSPTSPLCERIINIGTLVSLGQVAT